MTDALVIEMLARHMCEESGRDWNAPHTKRALWIRKAYKCLQLAQDTRPTLWQRIVWWFT